MHHRSPTATTPYSLPPTTYLLFLLLALALRWGSFFPSVIDHDESTYIVIAGELLRGEVYLRDLIDTKPIGIFWVYAVLIKLTGGSIVALRVAAAAVVALGAWLVARIVNRTSGTAAGGYVAGTVYLFMTSVFKHYGVAPNTEIFFNCFTIAAVGITVASGDKRWFLAGLLLGAGFVIKPFVAAEALAIGLYLVWYYRREPGRMIGKGLLLVGGFLLPVAGMVAYFAARGLLPELWFYGVEVSRGYASELTAGQRAIFVGDYFLRYAPLIILGAVAQVRGKFGAKQRRFLVYLLLQCVLVTVVVLLTGKRFGHYQVQLHPIVALWVGTTVGVAFPRTLARRWIAVAVVLMALAMGFVHYFYYRDKIDAPRIIADYLSPRLAPDETFFTISGSQIAYHLLDRPSPLPYIHPSLLFMEYHRANFGIDEQLMAERILDDPSVRYVIGNLRDPALTSDLVQRLLTDFEEYERLEDDLIVYRRR